MRLRDLALPLAAVLTVCSCAGALSDTRSLLSLGSLRIGVKADQPSLGLRGADGSFTGFDVDVALDVAERLGVDREDVDFVPLTSAQREEYLREGRVDLVVATYSITPARKTEVTFAGPYYVAHQDTLVRAEETSIRDVRDLEGRRLCQGEGSNSADRIIEERGIGARLVEAPSYSACVSMLAEGEADAVSTDDLILAGFLLQDRSAFKLVNAPFTDERYGIGVAEQDVSGCEAVNRAITDMYQDGTAERLLRTWFGDTGLDIVTSVPQFEGCS
ncbi:glutamate ABC transporter substrate-binding protein [Nocardiopsis mangrovi]|uniref:Glutamate ABC transporter substrate-binding protein n=1 Tax=Nocardiopsis mangrovi TaxID=1179818 RepID=A0ABV9E1J2_9ACTN